MTARALTRPVTKRTPRVSVHPVRPGDPQGRGQQRRIAGRVHGDRIGIPGFVRLGRVVNDGAEFFRRGKAAAYTPIDGRPITSTRRSTGSTVAGSGISIASA